MSNPQRPTGGSHWLVPADLHDPIETHGQWDRDQARAARKDFAKLLVARVELIEIRGFSSCESLSGCRI